MKIFIKTPILIISSFCSKESVLFNKLLLEFNSSWRKGDLSFEWTVPNFGFAENRYNLTPLMPKEIISMSESFPLCLIFFSKLWQLLLDFAKLRNGLVIVEQVKINFIKVGSN